MSIMEVIIKILVLVLFGCLSGCLAQVVDHCNPNPCTHGTCLERIDGFVCECMTNFTGIHCDIPDYCQSAPCLHGGKCTDTRTSFVCTCDGTGYTGPTCHLPFDDCASSPCKHGGTCVDEFKSFTCNCIPGFAGELCEVEMSACVSDPCKNGGTCVDVHAGTNPGQVSPSYKCQCVKGIAGANCEVNYDDCWMKPCHTGRCVDGINSYTCDCTGSGHSGVHCEHKNIDQCLLSPCQNSATCVQDKDDYHCKCLPFKEGLITHGGKNCSVLLRGCENIHACQNGGVCVPYLVNEEKNIHSYTCSCAHGYRGKVCESVTTMSVNKGSYIRKTYTKDFKLDLRFRTSEQQGVLLYYRIGQSFVSVEIVNGTLYLVSGNATTILTPKEAITSNVLSDSRWHHLVFDASDNITLTLSDPLCNSTADCTLELSLSSFPPDVFKEIFLGHVTVRPWLMATMSKTDFDGCIEDVMSNNDVIVPSNFGVAEFHSVHLSCPACLSRTCLGIGHCNPVNGTDFTCVCPAGIHNGQCPDDTGVTCNFDKGLCKWTQGTGDDFDWTRNSGTTGSSNTGPNADHTTGIGYYMYTEASSPRTQGQKAFLWSAYFDVLTPTCVSFWLNMYGNSMGTLHLYQRLHSNQQVSLVSVAGLNSPKWVEHRANLQTSRHTRLEFMGSIGNGYYSDMAIDDIKLEYKAC